MHRALLLPEIVAAISQGAIPFRGVLFKLLFVNRLFFKETSRILWYGCGERYNSATAGHVTPNIRHLAKVFTQDPQRAQLYANCIHTLYFDHEFVDGQVIEEARWHEDLKKLQFPRLQDVAFYGSDQIDYDDEDSGDPQDTAALSPGSVVIHYAQPNVQHYDLNCGSALSDSFLETMQRQCTKLRWLGLVCKRKNTISKDALLNFLEHNQSLEVLKMRVGFEFHECWSQPSFESISRFPNLQFVRIPDIEDGWIDSLQVGFPRLETLYTGVSEHGLQQLHRLVPNLTTLHLELDNLSPSHHMFASAAQFTFLKDFTVGFAPGSSIDGQDLLMLAQNCPSLTKLEVQDEHGQPATSGITDDVIDTLARHLPNIRVLFLLWDSDTRLTFRSLRSLGKHCGNLEHLAITCGVDFREVANLPKQVLFPKLWALDIFLGHGRGDWYEQSDGRIISLARRFTDLLPKLTGFALVNGNDTEETFEDHVIDICLGRE